MNLAPGDLGIDYSYGRPSLSAAVKAGAKFVLRYSAGAASAPSHPSHSANAGKLITPSEFRAILAAGLDIIANDEWYTTRITEGGTAGRQDGAAALALWRSCGLARGASIYVSWDAAVVSSRFASVAAYLVAYQKALAGYYLVDMYAGTPALRDMLTRKAIRYGWRPNAGSWSNDGLPYQPNVSTPARRAALVAQALKATPAHIWQTGNYWFDKTADENILVRVPVGSHREAATPAPTPPAPIATRRRRHDMSTIIYQVDPATMTDKTLQNCFQVTINPSTGKPAAPPEALDGESALGLAQAFGANITAIAQLPKLPLGKHVEFGGAHL